MHPRKLSKSLMPQMLRALGAYLVTAVVFIGYAENMHSSSPYTNVLLVYKMNNM